jgi:ribosomal protein L40E
MSARRRFGDPSKIQLASFFGPILEPMIGALTCMRCGADLRPSAKFCDECGLELRLTAVSGTPAEYKQVTVLFADVVIPLGDTSMTTGNHTWHAFDR